jgi:hypothetical protein
MTSSQDSDAVREAYKNYTQDSEELSVPETENARQKLTQELIDAFREEKNVLLDAPTSLGKTYSAATLLSDIDLDGQIMHFSKTKDARDEAKDQSQKSGLKTGILEGREDACSVASGDHDSEIIAPGGAKPSEWFQEKCDFGDMKFSDAHKELSEHVISNQHLPLPCSRDSMCESLTQAKDIQKNDIVHLTSNFALSEGFVKDKFVIFDERPGFISTTTKEGMTKYRKALSNFLERNSDFGYDSNDVFSADKDDDDWEQLREIFQSNKDMVKQEGEGYTHADAPSIGLAILNGEQSTNGRYYGEHGGIEVVFDDEIRVVHKTPDLSEAKAVVCLDAHPSEEIWEQELGLELENRGVLNPEDRKLWRKHERGLFIVQVGEATRSLTTGWRGMDTKADPLINRLREEFGEDFRTILTAKEVKQDAEGMMDDIGIKEPTLLHYGEQKSRNEFQDERVGLLVGCIDPGDDYVLDMLALAELEAKPETDGDGDRATGRGFVGKDSESAAEFLASVREENLSQSAGRYARNPEENLVSIVYCWSDAIPEEMTDSVVDGVSHKGKKLKKDMAEALRKDGGQMTTGDIAEEIDASTSSVSKYRDELIEEGVIEVDCGKGPNPDRYEYLSGEASLYDIDIGL